MILINRNEEFARCKEGNLALVLAAIKDGKLECRYGTSALSVERDRDRRLPPRASTRRRPTAPSTIECHRIIARLGATPPRKLVEGFGVQFPEQRSGRGAAALRDLRVERARASTSSARSAAIR